ncbi:MAG: phasin family protein [Robiginitomaculum sp.]|nr:MAG: phasin family protein [Robiginitomaculum sp.]
MTSQAKTNKARAEKPEAVKEPFENAAKASSDAMQDGFEQVVRTAGEFGDHVKANTDAMVQSLTIAGKGIEAINTEMSGFAKTSLEKGVATAQALAGAKSLQEVVELQSSFAKTAMESYLSGLNILTSMSTSLLQNAAKPINDRAQANAQLVQDFR